MTVPEYPDAPATPTFPGSSAPHRLALTVFALHGEAGASWLQRLPETIAACEQRWSLTALPPLDDLTYNYIAPALMRDATQVILKLGVPGAELNPEFGCEIEALRRFHGRGCVQLLAVDTDLGALLLERAVPGTTLAAVGNDDDTTRIAARVMQRLWRPVGGDHPFPTVSRWGRGFPRMRERFNGGTGPLPARITAKAERLFAELLDSSAPSVLLHGDLHHWNVLRAEREPWLAIDPKGVVGEPAYEVGALLRNRLDPPPEGDDAVALTRRRLHILAEVLCIDRERLQAWGLAQAVLSGWWDIEDGTGDGASAVRVAHILEQADA